MTVKIEITDKALKALRPGTATWAKLCQDEDGNARQRPIVWDSQVPGFGLRLSDKGTRTFVLVKRYPGSKQPAQREIGKYGEITLEKAREKARGWIALVSAGIDPADKEEEERNAEQLRKADTFAAAFELFVTSHLATLRTGKDVEAIMRRALMPKWGKRPIGEIARKDVIAIVYAIHDDGSPISANRVLAYIKKFFAWAVERGKLDASPAATLKKPAKERSRDRVLADHELRAIWRACGRCGAFGQAVRFMMATAARRTEAGSATWAEIDRDAGMWRLPSERTKAARAHELPLNDLALGCLGEARGEFVFSNDLGRTPLGGWSKSKIRLDKLALEELHKDRPDAAFLAWHLHDLRRSVATNMARLGVDRVVISKVLNHADGGVTAVYDRDGRDTEKVKAMAAWSRRLAQIIDPQPADVLPFERVQRT